MSLAQMMDRGPIPESVRTQWDQEFKEAQSDFKMARKTRGNDPLLVSPKSNVSITLELVDEAGGTLALGPIIQGKEAVDLLNIPLRSRLMYAAASGSVVEGRHLPIRIFEDTPGLCDRLITHTYANTKGWFKERLRQLKKKRPAQ
ncbi:MAG: hypothetical protein EOP09_03410 [Proteobacteria bacterium]|nr:MAG: hypothetical protein EOP09_03410 [Pseudomonadota bacterium]